MAGRTDAFGGNRALFQGEWRITFPAGGRMLRPRETHLVGPTAALQHHYNNRTQVLTNLAAFGGNPAVPHSLTQPA